MPFDAECRQRDGESDDANGCNIEGQDYLHKLLPEMVAGEYMKTYPLSILL